MSTQTKSNSMSFKRIVSDNFFLLKIIHSVCPFLIFSSIVFSAITAFARFISNTYMLRYALNGINENKSFHVIAATIISWLIVRLVLSATSTIYNKFYYDLQLLRASKEIYNLVYKKAAEVDISYYEKPIFYDDLSRALSECETRVNAILRNQTDLIYRLVSLITNVSLIITIDPKLVLFIFLSLLLAPLESRYNKTNYQQHQETISERRYKDYIQRTFYLVDYAKEMRLTNMSELLLKRFSSSSKHIIHKIKKYGGKLALLRYIIQIGNDVFISLGATVYAVSQTLVSHVMGYGDCLIVVNAIHNVAFTLTDSTNLILKVQDNALYIENLRKFLEYKLHIQDGRVSLPDKGDIVLENVSFRYDGAESNTLNNVCLRIKGDEKIAIVGHNGAGKTTLIKLLLRLYDCEGNINYGDINIKSFRVSDYRNIFATVMQDFNIFAFSIAENILLHKPRPQDNQLIKVALDKSGLLSKVLSFKHGINTSISNEFDVHGEQLSVGEKQKLAIARAYAKHPRFLILDEPTSALDPLAEQDFFNQLITTYSKIGIIYISHRLSAVTMADRIVLLENGSIIELGNHKELMERNGKYAEMFRRQAENFQRCNSEEVYIE